MSRHVCQQEQLMSVKLHVFIGMLLLLFTQPALALPVPGSQITNIASGDFTDLQGNLQVVTSNPVSLTVQKVYALDLIQNQQQIGVVGGQLNFPHVLTNMGNTTDSYTFSITQLTTDDYDLNAMAVYVDRNQDGLPDDNVNLLAGNSIQLAAGKSVSLVVAGTIPAGASVGQQALFDLKATSTYNTALSDTVNDVAKVVDDAVIHVTKSQNSSQGIVGSEITYTLTYTNKGTAARRVLLADVLNAGLQYKTGSATWSNGSGSLTDASDGNETGANSGVDYRVLGGNQIEFEVASVPPLSTGSLSFKVLVLSSAPDNIPNTASYTQYNAANTPLQTTNTNTVIYSLIHNLGVVANVNSASASNAGNPNAAPDNLSVISAASAGQEVFFDDYIWNTGEAIDTYNLSFVASNLPSCASVRLYAADGRTLLVDTNADGVVDTGSIAKAAARHIRVGVLFSPTCTSAGAIDIDLTARSITDNTVSDPVRNRVTLVAATGQTDLYNSDNSGTGIGNVDNAGAAWISKPIAAGSTAVFPLVINNTGTTANNYGLYASSSAIDLNTLATTAFPAGWQVSFYEGDATCTNLGVQITNSGNVPANSTKQYCAVVSAPVGATGSDLPVWFAIESAINHQGDVIKNQVVLGAVRNLSLVTDQQGQIQPGGTMVYLHTLKNMGSVVEGDAVGEVLLSVTPQNASDDFIYTLYYDVNNNGQLDAVDVPASDLASITANSGLAPNQSIQLLLKVQAPVTATNGLSSQADLNATPVGTVQGLSLAALKNTDTTTVNPSQLRLVKSQVKDESCSAVSYPALSYSVTAVQVKPDQCVVYRLSVKNEGISAVNSVVIQDVVPAFTTLRVPPGVLASQGSASVSGDIISGAIGTLNPQQEEHLYFSIRVNP